MYRIIEGKVHGVLTDYDLSSWKATLTAEKDKSSQQTTGTPPYMAQELLRGTSTIHLYRHDVESLFYVMLTVCGRRTIKSKRGNGDGDEWQVDIREGKLPYQDWFESQDSVLGCLKIFFFIDMDAIELSPSFEAFRMWLQDLQWLFSDGFALKFTHVKREERAGSNASGLVPFDDETLGGCIDYSTFIEPTRHLTGELKGLAIRYDPSPHSLRASTDSVLVGDVTPLPILSQS